MRPIPLSVLILDLRRSKKPDEDLLEVFSEKGLQVKSVRQVDEAKQLMTRGRTQLVFALVGKKEPPQFGSLLRQLHTVDDDVPVVVLATHPSFEQSLDVLRGRAYDFLQASAYDEIDATIDRIVEEKGYLLQPEERLQTTLGERLRATRLERQLTLRQLAQRAGVSTSLVSQVELGHSAASVTTLYRIARALRLRLTDLFQGY